MVDTSIVRPLCTALGTQGQRLLVLLLCVAAIQARCAVVQTLLPNVAQLYLIVLRLQNIVQGASALTPMSVAGRACNPRAGRLGPEPWAPGLSIVRAFQLLKSFALVLC